MSDSPNDGSDFRLERELAETLRPVVARAAKTIGAAIEEGFRTQTRISGVRLPTLGTGLRSQLRGPSDISCGAGG